MKTKKYLTIEAHRTGYSVDQIARTLTVEELIGILEDYDMDTEVYISNDNGYTYGGIRWDDILEDRIEIDDDEYDEDEDEEEE